MFTFVSQCIVAVNKKSAYRVDALTSCQQLTVTVKAQTHQTKLNYQTVSKASRTFVDQHTSPAPDQTNHTVFTSIAAQDLTYFLPVFPWHLNETSYLQSEISSLRSRRVNRGMSCLTDDAYLLTALRAWADPMCRSFCRSHRFFSLGRGERREDDVSVISKYNWIMKRHKG